MASMAEEDCLRIRLTRTTSISSPKVAGAFPSPPPTSPMCLLSLGGFLLDLDPQNRVRMDWRICCYQLKEESMIMIGFLLLLALLYSLHQMQMNLNLLLRLQEPAHWQDLCLQRRPQGCQHLNHQRVTLAQGQLVAAPLLDHLFLIPNTAHTQINRVIF